jgi:predicted nucleotidyltransferase
MESASVARQLASRLSQDRAITALCLLGSVARGDATPGSDIDILAITTEERRPTELLVQAGETGSDARMSLMVRSEELFDRLAGDGALFVLHTRLEGKILFDRARWLQECLATTADVPPNPGATIAWAEGELDRYRDLRRFNGIFLFALARIYSASRALAIALTVREGSPYFARNTAFDAVRDWYPQVSGEVDRLRALAPFHARADGKQVRLPFDHHGATYATAQALADAGRLSELARS